MARIPKSTVRPTGQVALASERPLRGVGPEIARISAAFSDIDRKIESARKSRIVNEKTLDASKADKDFQFDFDENPDKFETINDDYKSFSDEKKANLLSDVNDPVLKADLENRLDNIFFKGGFNIEKKARSMEIEAGGVALNNTIQDFEDNYSIEDNPRKRQLLLDDVNAKINVAQDVGYIGIEDQDSFKDNAARRAELARMDIIISTNPENAPAEIIKSTILSPVDKTKLVDKNKAALKAKVFSDERVEVARFTEIKREQTIQYNEAGRGVMLGIVDETSVTDMLERRDIDFKQAEDLIEAIRNPGADVDDSGIAVNLRQDIYDGDANERDVMKALNRQSITKDTAEELLDKVDIVGRRGGPLADDNTKRARDYLDANVGGVRGAMAKLDTQSSRRLAGAMREFDERVLAGEKPWEIADEIIPRYQKVKTSTQALKTPLTLVGTKTQPNLIETKKQLIKLFKNGQILESVFEREAELLEQWDEVIK